MRALLTSVQVTRVSLALLSAAFLLGCQDVGTGVEGPDGLVPQFARGGGKGKPGGSDEEPTVGTMFDVVVTGDVRFSGRTTLDSGGELILEENENLGLNPDFFGPDNLTCSLGELVKDEDLPLLTYSASLWLPVREDDDDLLPHVHLIFKFEHNEIGHKLRLLGKWDQWPPTEGEDGKVTLTPLNGEWGVSSKGRNHQDACIGNFIGSPESEISWEATVTLVTPVP